MHAVAISEVERSEPANRFAAACTLPMRRALPVLHMPVIFNFAPSEPRHLRRESARGGGCVKTLKSQQGGELFLYCPFFNRGHSAIPL
jgi:hypothetical protein